MTNHGRRIRLILPIILAGAALALLPNAPSRLLLALPPQMGSQGSGFIGTRCAQGDPQKHASITDRGGGFLALTNENGDSSVGNITGPNTVSAPQWQFVTGSLSSDGRRINWSNGTFWAHCRGGGGGGGGNYPYPVNLTGKWFPNGNRSQSCSIRQRHVNLSLQNESGQSASGSFTGKRSITTSRGGNMITGNISQDGNRIDWSNGTYWIRFRVY